jgi:hypothetical protein
MNLSDLRPTQPTELALLSASLRGNNSKAAVPSALSEHFLISVARDLRMLEQDEEDQQSSSYLAAPLMLVFFLFTGSRKGKAKFTIGESAVYRSLHVYQWAVEREIVTRLVGAGGLNDEATLLKRLETLRTASDYLDQHNFGQTEEF